MVKRRFCDRCDAEIADAGVAHVDLLRESDEDAGGTITDDWDLCAPCLALFEAFMETPLADGPPR